MIFNFDTDYILQNDIVLLRPLMESDHQYLMPFSAFEPDLWKYGLQTAAGQEALKDNIHAAIQSKLNKNAYPFIVFDKRVGKYAGSTRFCDIQPSADNIQIGYTWYGKDFHGNGLNKNCKFLLLEFAFEVMQIQRVEFRADLRNAHSIAAMKSIGCIQEGILRSNGYSVNGERRDSVILSIIKQDWFDNVKANLLKRLS